VNYDALSVFAPSGGLWPTFTVVSHGVDGPLNRKPTAF